MGKRYPESGSEGKQDPASRGREGRKAGGSCPVSQPQDRKHPRTGSVRLPVPLAGSGQWGVLGVGLSRNPATAAYRPLPGSPPGRAARKQAFLSELSGEGAGSDFTPGEITADENNLVDKADHCWSKEAGKDQDTGRGPARAGQ